MWGLICTMFSEEFLRWTSCAVLEAVTAGVDLTSNNQPPSTVLPSHSRSRTNFDQSAPIDHEDIRQTVQSTSTVTVCDSALKQTIPCDPALGGTAALRQSVMPPSIGGLASSHYTSDHHTIRYLLMSFSSYVHQAWHCIIFFFLFLYKVRNRWKFFSFISEVESGCNKPSSIIFLAAISFAHWVLLEIGLPCFEIVIRGSRCTA